MGHENAEGVAHVGVRVEPTVRLAHVVEGLYSTVAPISGTAIYMLNRAGQQQGSSVYSLNLKTTQSHERCGVINFF